MAFTEEDGITEMTKFDVERVDAVGTPANGTDWLLLKSAVAKRDEDPDVGGGVDRDKLPASDFAGKHRSFPIVTPGDVSDAASSIGRAGDDNYSSDKLKANIIRIAKRKGPKFVAQLPKSWRKKVSKKMPAVHDAPDGADSIPPESLPSGAPASSAAATLPTDGQGSELGSQSTDPSALTGQTMDNCDHPSGGSGDQQERQDSQTQKAKTGKKTKKAEKAKKRRQMVSAAHEDKDVAIGRQTIAALRQALGLAETFTHREESEATAAGTASKGADEMTHDELVALIRETNAQVKKERKQERKSKKAEKSADAKKIRKLEKRLAAVEEQPARPHPILADASVAAKKGDVAKDGDPFRPLHQRVEEATSRGNVSDVMRARKQLDTARLISIETARREGRLPRSSDIGDNAVPILTGAHLLPDDPNIRGI